MDSRQLRYFKTIYEHRSLSTASRHLRVAVSALSHHLTRLESELNTLLFIRQPRGLQPTASGELLYQHARRILRAMQAAEQDVRNASGHISGPLAVSMAYSAVKAIGVPLLQGVQRDFPDLQLTLTESLSGMSLAHLLAADVDLALVYNPPTDPELVVLPVLEERMLCIGHASVIGSSKEPLTFAEVLELPLILLRNGASAQALITDGNLLKKLEHRARWHLNSVYAITGALEAGIGCVIGTRLFMQEQLESGQLQARPLISPVLSRRLCLCYTVDRPATFALEAVRDLLMRLAQDAVQDGRWEARWLGGDDQCV